MSIENITIKNEFLTVRISTLGAELKSITDITGKEWLHQGDMIFWNQSAPILFPVCGNVTDNTIKVKGKKYNMKGHGFAMTSEFNLMECTEDLAVFSLVSNDETKKIYPYDFELIVTYKLLGKSIDVSFEVINDSEETMYFSIGAHEGYICIEGLSNYQLVFENKEFKKPVYTQHEPAQAHINTENGYTQYHLCDELFDDTMPMFIQPESNAVSLVNKETGEKVRVEFEDFDNLLVWSKPGAQYVCIEPWCGMAEFGKVFDDISKKDDIHSLEPNEQFEIHHIITIN